MVTVYSSLPGFPTPAEQPSYYNLLRNVGLLTEKPEVSLLVATTPSDEIAGTVVYVGDIQHYGSGGIATREYNSAGFRLLAVTDAARGKGVGKLLTQACIDKARPTGPKSIDPSYNTCDANSMEDVRTVGFLKIGRPRFYAR